MRAVHGGGAKEQGPAEGIETKKKFLSQQDDTTFNNPQIPGTF